MSIGPLIAGCSQAPLLLSLLAQVLAPSELVGVAETGRARLMRMAAVVDEPSTTSSLNATLLMYSLGSWSFPRSRAPHDDVRVGCLNVYSGVRTNRHQPIERGHHNHRPSGTSPAEETWPSMRCARSGCAWCAHDHAAVVAKPRRAFLVEAQEAGFCNARRLAGVRPRGFRGCQRAVEPCPNDPQ